jgi:hypothetical protein
MINLQCPKCGFNINQDLEENYSFTKDYQLTKDLISVLTAHLDKLDLEREAGLSDLKP